MVPFDPLAANDTIKRSTPGLADAYAVACEAGSSEYDLNYWKAILASSEDRVPIVIDSDEEDWSGDPEMLRAIQMGIIDGGSQKTHLRSTPPATHTLQSNIKSRPSASLSKGFAFHPYSTGLQLPIRRPVQRSPRPLTSVPSLPSPPDRYSSHNHYSRSPKRPSPPSIKLNDELPATLQRRRLNDYIEDSKQADLLCQSPEPAQRILPPIFYLSDDDDGQPQPPLRKRPSPVTEPPPSRNIRQQITTSIRKSPTPSLSAAQVFRRNGLNTSASVAPENDILEEDLYVMLPYAQSSTNLEQRRE